MITEELDDVVLEGGHFGNVEGVKFQTPASPNTASPTPPVEPNLPSSSTKEQRKSNVFASRMRIDDLQIRETGILGIRDQIGTRAIPDDQRQLSKAKALFSKQTQAMASFLRIGKVNANAREALSPVSNSSLHRHSERDTRGHSVKNSKINTTPSDAVLHFEDSGWLFSNKFESKASKATVSDGVAPDDLFPAVQNETKSPVRTQPPNITENPQDNFGESANASISSSLDVPETWRSQVAPLSTFKYAEGESLLGRKEYNENGMLREFKVSSVVKLATLNEALDIDGFIRERFRIEREEEIAFRKIQAAEVSDYLRLARKARVGCSAKYNAKNSLSHLDKLERQIMLDSLEAHECRLKTELLNEVTANRKTLNEICNLESGLVELQWKFFWQDYATLFLKSSLAGTSKAESDSKLAPNYDTVMDEAINTEVRRQLEVQRWVWTNVQKPEKFFSDFIFEN